jgi:glycosyltransferase involved in cell wall biosynthesis
MNIGMIIYGRLDTLTGGYIYDRMLVERLQQCGHRLEIVSLPRQHYTRHLLDNVSPGLFSRLVSADFDLLLQDELIHPSIFRMNYRLRKISDVPIVTIVHQVLCRQPRNGLLNRLYETVERPYLNSVDAFIFNSKTTRHTVEQLINGRRPSIVAFPAGDRLGWVASPNRIVSRAQAPGPLKLIFVGNVLPNKGLLPLIQGLSKLPSETWHLTVAGSQEMDRRYLRKVEKLIVAKNLKQQVVLVGSRDGPELASLLVRSHVFVMPYSHEGFGMAHLEAMGFALPVIGSSSGALREFVIPDINGFLIEPGDFKTVLKCISRLYQDRQRLIKMSRAALRTFHGRPKWKDTLEAIEGFLTEVQPAR